MTPHIDRLRQAIQDGSNRREWMLTLCDNVEYDLRQEARMQPAIIGHFEGRNITDPGEEE